MMRILIFSILLMICFVNAKVCNVEQMGAVAGDKTASVALKNAQIISSCLQTALPGDTVLVPQVGDGNDPLTQGFFTLGSIEATNKQNLTFIIQGAIVMSDDIDQWPITNGNHENGINLVGFKDLTISGGGKILGQGLKWYFEVLDGKLKDGRPRMMMIGQTEGLLIENLYLHDSPSYHMLISDCKDVEIRGIHVEVDMKRLADEVVEKNVGGLERKLGGLEPWLLNTDGIDVSGTNIYVHDCTVNNDDDSLCVKPCSGDCTFSNCSENILFENSVMTGFGATIGSVPPRTSVNCVRNVTFRNNVMPGTGKGVYVKSNPTCSSDPNNRAVIADILYQNLTIIKPKWWAIWIGPQQQHEPHQALGRKCGLSWPVEKSCPTQGCVTFTNIVLKDVRVVSPLLSPGVVMGNSTTHNMNGIVFDNVVVEEPGIFPFDGQFYCHDTNVKVLGDTYPVPNCVNEVDLE